MWAEPTPTEGFSRGDSGLSPAWRLRVRPWLKLPPPCPKEANLDLATATL